MDGALRNECTQSFVCQSVPTLFRKTEKLKKLQRLRLSWTLPMFCRLQVTNLQARYDLFCVKSAVKPQPTNHRSQGQHVAITGIFMELRCHTPLEKLLLCPRERLRSIVMSMSVCVCVCLCVCPRGYLRNCIRDLCQIFVHVAYVRSSVILRHADDRPHRLSAGRGWRKCTAWRSVIYDCLVEWEIDKFVFKSHAVRRRRPTWVNCTRE